MIFIYPEESVINQQEDFDWSNVVSSSLHDSEGKLKGKGIKLPYIGKNCKFIKSKVIPSKETEDMKCINLLPPQASSQNIDSQTTVTHQNVSKHAISSTSRRDSDPKFLELPRSPQEKKDSPKVITTHLLKIQLDYPSPLNSKEFCDPISFDEIPSGSKIVQPSDLLMEDVESSLNSRPTKGNEMTKMLRSISKMSGSSKPNFTIGSHGSRSWRTLKTGKHRESHGSQQLEDQVHRIDTLVDVEALVANNADLNKYIQMRTEAYLERKRLHELGLSPQEFIHFACNKPQLIMEYNEAGKNNL